MTENLGLGDRTDLEESWRSSLFLFSLHVRIFSVLFGFCGPSISFTMMESLGNYIDFVCRLVDNLLHWILLKGWLPLSSALGNSWEKSRTRSCQVRKQLPAPLCCWPNLRFFVCFLSFFPPSSLPSLLSSLPPLLFQNLTILVKLVLNS